MSHKLRLLIIACGVFEDELRVVAERSPNALDVRMMNAGLHAAPDRLRLEAQEAVDSAARAGDCDAVCLVYGRCGGGTVGLIARDVPLVVPRVHDCISLFLGSARAYREQFARFPGTFYFTTGWYGKKAHPETLRAAAARRFDPTTHAHFEEFRRQYGEENARYIVEFLESWRRNYQRAALIDHGFAEPRHEELTRAVAEAAGWDYERLEGSLALLQDLADGKWDEERFLVAPPGHVVVATNDERVFAAVPAPEDAVPMGRAARVDAVAGVEAGSFLYRAAPAGPSPDVGPTLGIDAGGTYTDAVVCDPDTGGIPGEAKSLTTHHNLAEGVAGALRALDPALLAQVRHVCLSTTLATNAIVEGRGRAVGLLLMPYHEDGASRIKTPLLRTVSARMNIQGVEEAPLDAEEVVAAARSMVGEGAAAFAVSGYGAVRNPRHELEAKEILGREFGLPVVCGHELTGRLNFVARAHTAVLNARLVPLIEGLLDAARRVLADVGVRAPVFVVRGDGSVIREEVARSRPVETVLSGPAASAAGALFLTGCRDALVVDMGGTTTDVAALKDGELTVDREGAQVGAWRTSVRAADIQTTGLGGDSAVRADGPGELRVGPDRVIPLCMLVERCPAARDELERLARAGAAAESAAMFALDRPAAGVALAAAEARIVDLLSERPRSLHELAAECGSAAPQLVPVRRLERIGLVRRSAPTPTDALHVLGTWRPHDAEAARLAMRLLGGPLRLDETETARLVVQATERELARALVRRELAEAGVVPSKARFDDLRGVMDLALADAGADTFGIEWRQRRPIVGIGAPVAAYLPAACRRLGIEPLIPAHAHVANAVGAAVSKVVVREQALIRPSQVGGYVLHCRDERREFGLLGEAVEAARGHVVELARRRAGEFGTGERDVRVQVTPRTGRLSDGSAQLLEVVVEGYVAGSPVSDRTGQSVSLPVTSGEAG